MESGPVSKALADLWEPTLPIGLFCLSSYKGRSLVLFHPYMLCFVNAHGRPAPFRTETAVGGGEQREGTGRKQEKKREGKLWSGCKINKKCN